MKSIKLILIHIFFVFFSQMNGAAYLGKARMALSSLRMSSLGYVARGTVRSSATASNETLKHVRPRYSMRFLAGIFCGVIAGCGSYSLREHAYQKGCSFFVAKQSKKMSLKDLVAQYNDLKKQSETTEDKMRLEKIAHDILDYFVDNYQETKAFLKAKGLNLNELLTTISQNNRQLFCEKAVMAPWFWDFQRKTYYALFTLPAWLGGLEAQYTLMLCKAATSLKKNPIAGFKEEAFQERQKVLKIYVDGKTDSPFACFKHDGALGQKNEWCFF